MRVEGGVRTQEGGERGRKGEGYASGRQEEGGGISSCFLSFFR